MSTPKIVQQPGSGTTNEDAIIGATRQIRIDTDRNEARLHDGVTAGGHRLPNYETILQLIEQYLLSVGKSTLVFYDTIGELHVAPTGNGILAVVNGIPDPTIVNQLPNIYKWYAGTANNNYFDIVTASTGGYWAPIGNPGIQPNGFLLTDFNNVFSLGLYRTLSSASHGPGAAIEYSLINGGGNSDQVQIAFLTSGLTTDKNQLYFRHVDVSIGTWSPWSLPLGADNTNLYRGNDKLAIVTYNGIGSYLLGQSSSAIIAPGATAAGSTITPAGLTSVPAIATAGGVRSGTWQAMGDHPAASGVTLWVRTV